MKLVLTSVASLLGIFGTAYGTVWWMDGRYAPVAAVEKINWSLLKQNIRDIREELRDNPNDPELREELEIFLDELCLEYPNDRACRNRNGQ